MIALIGDENLGNLKLPFQRLLLHFKIVSPFPVLLKTEFSLVLCCCFSRI